MEIVRLYADDVMKYRDKLKKLLKSCYDSSEDIEVPNEVIEQKLDGLICYLRDNRAFLFGAVENDELYGFLWSYIVETPTIKVIHVAYAAVDERATGRGLFTALNEESEKLAKSIGINTSELRVSTKNEKVLRIHGSHGYEPTFIVMRKKLD